MRVEIENPRKKCYACRRAMSTCLCKHVHPIQTNTRFVILMHPKEAKKEKNGTGYMTNLQLENSEVIVGVDFTNNRRVNEILNTKKNNCFLLYPGLDNFNLSTTKREETNTFLGKNLCLFILDGTWPCARKMLKLSKNLQQLQRVSFDNTITSKFVIKQQPEPLCLSTIESVYTVLNLLKKSEFETCNTDRFLLPFEKMVEQQIECIMNPNNKNHYRPKENPKITPKNIYKKTSERNIIFEENR